MARTIILNLFVLLLTACSNSQALANHHNERAACDQAKLSLGSLYEADLIFLAEVKGAHTVSITPSSGKSRHAASGSVNTKIQFTKLEYLKGNGPSEPWIKYPYGSQWDKHRIEFLITGQGIRYLVFAFKDEEGQYYMPKKARTAFLAEYKVSRKIGWVKKAMSCTYGGDQ